MTHEIYRAGAVHARARIDLSQQPQGILLLIWPLLVMTPGTLMAATPSAPAVPSELAQRLELKPGVQLRLRQEFAEQDGKPDDASSTTLRHRLGIHFRLLPALTGLVESEGTVSLFAQNYNSGPGGNGRVNFPVVADPTGDELNQAYLHWQADDSTSVRVGRQRLIHDNARFIGNVGWRQNEQTYDAAEVQWSPVVALRARYAYLQKINTIFFGERDTDSHLLHLQFAPAKTIALSAFLYALDDDDGEDTRTLGLRAAGHLHAGGLTWRYSATVARQQDYADSRDIDSDYLALEAGAAYQGFSVTLGHERLGSDGTRGFSTPLATLHAFNGWADVFLVTPGAGLVDNYAGLGVANGPWKALAAYHVFTADSGAADYGTELDLLLGYRVGKSAGVTLKFADYRADTFDSDTTRLVAQVDLAI